jgi:hypothetical protein
MQDVTVLRDFDDFTMESQQLGIMIKSYTDVGSIPAPGGKSHSLLESLLVWIHATQLTML